MSASRFKLPRMTIHQFHPCATAHDAVTNHMIFIQKSLKEIGIDGEIFAKEIKGTRVAKPFSPTSAWNCDLFLIHHSQGNPSLNALLKIEIPKALIYHNITPSQFFRHDPYIAALCDSGRNQLSKLRKNVVASFAVSQVNAAELTANGFESPQLMPLFDLSQMPTLEKKTAAKKGKPLTLLFVGKMLPHKNQALLLKTLYYLKPLLEREVRLVLIGGKDPVYGIYLRMLSSALGLDRNVKFVGKASHEKLWKGYQEADAFIVSSLHEGFGIPIVEAMHAEIPVFAFETPGVQETLGGAGVELLSQEPQRVAASLANILTNKNLIKTIVAGQNRRLEEIGKFQTKERVQDLCLELLKTVRTAPGERRVGAEPIEHAKLL